MNPSSLRDWLRDVEYLVFSGGGVRGLAFLGTMEILNKIFDLSYDKDLFNSLKGYSGASAGAVFATYLCLHDLGLTKTELWEEIVHCDMNYVVVDSDFSSFYESWGLNDKNRIRNKIGNALEKYTGNRNITFKELYELTNKDLVISVSCVDGPTKGEYHSHTKTPNYSVCSSVLASMSIPVIFSPEKINGHYYVDGAFFDNLPLVFDVNKTLAFRIITEDNTTFDKQSVLGMPSYFYRVMMLSILVVEEEKMKSIPSSHVVNLIMPGDISPVDFYISPEKRIKILEAGVRSFLYWLQPELVESIVVKSITELIVP